MTYLRSIVLLFALFVGLTLGQVSGHHGSQHNQIRVRRQITEKDLPEIMTLENEEKVVGETRVITPDDQNDVEQETEEEKNIAEEIPKTEDNIPENEEQQVTPKNEEQGVIPEKEEHAELVENEELNVITENEEQDVIRENEEQENAIPAVNRHFWTTCDYITQHGKSCYDCNNLLICKQIGGLVKPCGNPFRPHCNNGQCSPVPSIGCA